MRKEFLLKWVLVLLSFPLAQTYAQKRTPIETFIAQVKETNTFSEVSNIWQADEHFDKTELLNNVSKATPLTIDYNILAGFIKKNNTAIKLVVPGVDGGTFTIDLAQYNFLSNNFEVHARGYNNSDGICNYTPGLYYSGVVKGIPGSVAAFSFFKNEVYGIFSIPGVGNYVLVPNTMVGKDYDYNQHYILYNDNDLKIKDQAPGCGTDKLPLNYMHTAERTTTTLNNNVYSNCRTVMVYEVADHTMYLKKTSTTNVTNYLTALFNNQAAIYRNEGLPIALSYLEIDTVADVYGTITAQNSLRYLDKFGYTTQNTMHGCGVAILFTTHTGNMGGVAWLQSGCTSYYAADSAGPYAFCNINNSSSTTVTAFPTYSWDVEVSAHEMGHVVGSPHTHACCWNPPARNTAIDACYTLEGSCATPSPAHPTGGGTIMSYCHLTSVGINFSLGFGQQPGDTIRRYLSQYTCGTVFTPTVTLSKPNRTISANRECIDLINGITTYWKDNNTVSMTDDTLVLMIKKNGNNIGDLNTTGFAVTTTTVANYGSGFGDTILFRTGLAGTTPPNYGMRRYWKVKPIAEPTSAVDVFFPFLSADSADINGSSPGHLITDFRMYKVTTPVNPNPIVDSFMYAADSNVNIYTYSGVASTTKWSLTQVGSNYLARMKMTKLGGGGSGFYSYSPSEIGSVSPVNSGIFIYPNPTNGQWFVSVEKSNGNDQLIFQLYTADGKMAHTQTLQNGTVNTVGAQDLPTGVYFYRIISNTNVYTGNLIKR